MTIPLFAVVVQFPHLGVADFDRPVRWCAALISYHIRSFGKRGGAHATLGQVLDQANDQRGKEYKNRHLARADLSGASRFGGADASRAVLSRLAKRPFVNLAADADTEGRFKK